MAANVVLALPLFAVLGSVGIAIATTLASWIQLVLLAVTLLERKEFVFDPTFTRRFPAICVANLIMGVAVWAMAHGLAAWFEPVSGALIQVTSLILLVGSGLAVYAGAAALLGAFDAKSLLQRLGAG